MIKDVNCRGVISWDSPLIEWHVRFTTVLTNLFLMCIRNPY